MSRLLGSLLVALPLVASGQLRILDGPVGDRVLVLLDAPEANRDRVHGCKAGVPAWLDADGAVSLPTGPVCDGQLFPQLDRMLVTRIDARVQVLDVGSGLPEVEFSEATDARLSDDGGRIAFLRFTRRRPSGMAGDAPLQVVVASADGAEERVVLAAPHVFAPVWSPDGALYVMGGPDRARINRVVDGRLQPIAGTPPLPEEYPVFATPTTWLYEAKGHLWELDVASGRIISLLEVPRPPRGARLRGVGGVQTFAIFPEPEGPKIVAIETLRGLR